MQVTDSEGRRRFHGAFSGGFSAGYFNSVGSKEGVFVFALLLHLLWEVFWIGDCLFSGALCFCEKISATVYEFESNIMFDRGERECPHAGWAPQSFKSSRKARADKREQNAYDFMDEDEKAVIAICLNFVQKSCCFI